MGRVLVARLRERFWQIHGESRSQNCFGGVLGFSGMACMSPSPIPYCSAWAGCRPRECGFGVNVGVDPRGQQLGPPTKPALHSRNAEWALCGGHLRAAGTGKGPWGQRLGEAGPWASRCAAPYQASQPDMSVSPPPPPRHPPGSREEQRGPGRAVRRAGAVWPRPDCVLPSRCGPRGGSGPQDAEWEQSQSQRRSGCGWQLSFREGSLLGLLLQPLLGWDPGSGAPAHTGGPRGCGSESPAQGPVRCPEAPVGEPGLRGQQGRNPHPPPPSVHSQDCCHGPFQSCTHFSFLNSASCHKFGQESRWGD